MNQGLNYYIIDLETTGLSAQYHEVIEISVIRASDRLQLTRYVRAQYPERASLDALEATGKKLSDLNVGKKHSEVVQEVNNFFQLDKGFSASRCIVGHNIAAFDVKFLHAMWEKEGCVFPADLYLDTLLMTKQFLKTHDVSHLDLPKTARGKVSTKLASALQITGAKTIANKFHTAQDDTRNTYSLWKKLVEDHKMDYLSHIKNIPHAFTKLENINDLDPLEVE